MLGIGGFFGYRYATHLTQDKIRISINPWVGFTPFSYAQEKGWLEQTPFRFVWHVDLTEGNQLYERGLTQGFTATQYDPVNFMDASQIKPVFLIDRSNGSDAILSNRTLAALRDTHEPVTVFLERGWLQDDFFKAFVQENGLQHLQFILTNKAVKSMTSVNSNGAPVILISYAPYISELIRSGFVTVASTRTLKSFFVIDALFVNDKFIPGQEAEFQALKAIFHRAVNQLRINPREYYNTVQPYLEGQSYEEFMASVNDIEWLDHTASPAIVQQLQAQHLKTDRLLP
ncbi:hypothetical protein [Sulfuriferula nivalis]|uniref:Uncharacterized protein n=1 Tax=Sulfuriferula nivalis TaxID=2675298 RepID=A0A809RFV2_9PROT|nr:hypothetical protein [Sulfuriferula nivalis]BBP00719.1 hypothetical protein SFSGTM_14270 [Sulfuriferula nivalis]